MKKILNYVALFFILSVFLFTGCNSNKVTGKENLLKQNPAIVDGKLDNGMSYYILKNTEPKNRISLRLVVKAGSCMEDEDQKGIAHFVEHMCFNGTEHFEKNSLVDYAESIGMGFGPEINAETNFETTIYQLEIPADNPEYLKTALLILHDWASSVTFDPEEIEKERGVIVEDWRVRRGLQSRFLDAFISFLYKDSVYEKRLPIGDMNIVQTIPGSRIVDFYKKWYRPELMSVVVSGDFDTNVMKKEIEQVMKDIPASKNKIEAPVFDIPVNNDKKVLLFKDPEMPNIEVQLLNCELNPEVITTEESFRRNYAQNLLSFIISKRLSDHTKKADSNYIAASSAYSSNTKNAVFRGMYFVPKNGKVIDSLKDIFDEYDRILMFGVTEDELQLAKNSFASGEKDYYEKRLGINSNSRVNDIINHVLTGKVCLSDDDNYKYAQKAINLITVEEINEIAKEVYKDRGSYLMILAPQNEVLPSEKEIINLWKNYQNEIKAQEQEVVLDSLMERPAKKAKIVSKKEIKELGAKEYVLENGAKIITKKTDYDKDLILFNAISKGGYSLVSDEEYPSAEFCFMYSYNSGIGDMSITQLQRFISDKNLSFNFGCTKTTDYFSAQSTNKDLEVLLQVFNQLMCNPKFNDEAWNYCLSIANINAQSYGSNAENLFNIKVNQTLYGDTVRNSGINNKYVSLMDQKLSEKLFRERFSNAADFTFTFTGDFDEKKLLDLCCYYIGAIPGDESKKEEIKEEPYTFPSGKSVTVKKGTADKGMVFLSFGGTFPQTADVTEEWKNEEMLGQLRYLIELRLYEEIRESMSGAYTISVGAGVQGQSKKDYQIQICFPCEPQREQELTQEVIATIKDLQENLVDSLYITKLNENWKRTYEIAKVQNEWCSGKLSSILVMQEEPLSCFNDDKTIVNMTTAEQMQKIAKEWIDINNVVSVYLVPEK